MATMPDGRPLLIGPTPIRDWSSRQVSFNRFLKAFKAALSSCGLVAGGKGSGMRRVLLKIGLFYPRPPHHATCRGKTRHPLAGGCVPDNLLAP